MKQNLARWLAAAAAAAFLALLPAPPAGAVDGTLLAIQQDPDAQGSVRGSLIRHDVKGDKVVATEVIYDGDDATYATLSPDGRRVAFVRDGESYTLAVVDAGGGKVTDLTAVGSLFLAWPAGDGGQWVYYWAQNGDQRPRALHRVNVETKETQFVVELSAFGDLALSQDATRTSGRLFVQAGGWLGVAGYDLSHGHGDLYQRVLGAAGAGYITASPDGSSYAVVGDDHGEALHIHDWNGGLEQAVRLDDGDETWHWDERRWSVNSADWLVASQFLAAPGDGDDGPGGSRTDVLLYNLADGRQVRIADMPPGVHHIVQGFWDTAGEDYGLGFFAGEAPFTVDLRAGVPDGDWKWDYGDGSPPERGAGAGRHVYEQGGAFTVTARDGDAVLEGQVTVNDQAAPTALAADLLDNQHLLVTFDEPVLLAEEAEVTFDAGPVSAWRLDDNGTNLMVELAESPGAAAGELTLRGVTDRAQVANPLAEETVSVDAPAWPSDRTDLAYLWEAADAPNVVLGPSGREPLYARVLREGLVKFDRHGAMRLAGGAFVSDDLPRDFLGGEQAPAATVEAVIRADAPAPAAGRDDDAEPPPVISIGIDDDESTMLVIRQRGDHLELTFERHSRFGGGKSKPVELCALAADGRPHHVLLSASPDSLACYLDGRQTVNLDDQNNAAPPLGARVLFAATSSDVRGLRSSDDRSRWRGTIEGVALYRRAVGPDEAAANAEYWLKRIEERGNIPQLEVEAKLLATTVTPRPEAIAPYRDALVVYEYEVVDVARGEYGGKKLRVAHYGLVNAEPTAVTKARPGSKRRLVLELFTDRPDLAETMTHDTLPEDFDTPLYVEAD